MLNTCMDKILMECKKHGMTEFYVVKRKDRPSDAYKCCKCNVEAVTKRRRGLKELAVNYKGGVCYDCGLRSQYYQVYDFHHLDPTQKDFNIGHNGHTRSWDKTKEELDKCVMLCATCHRIRHAKEDSGSSGRTRTYNGKQISDRLTADCDTNSAHRRSQTKEPKPRPTKINWPSDEELRERLSKSNYSALGRELGVSDNAIRKRLS